MNILSEIYYIFYIMHSTFVEVYYKSTMKVLQKYYESTTINCMISMKSHMIPFSLCVGVWCTVVMLVKCQLPYHNLTHMLYMYEMLCICICKCVCKCICVYVEVCFRTWTCICTSICLCVCICICICICMCMCICICICICVYIHMYEILYMYELV